MGMIAVLVSVYLACVVLLWVALSRVCFNERIQAEIEIPVFCALAICFNPRTWHPKYVRGQYVRMPIAPGILLLTSDKKELVEAEFKG